MCEADMPKDAAIKGTNRGHAEGSVSIAKEPGLSVDWRDLSVTINGTRALLPCSGGVKAGSITAVMGASGSGKTTLLNALSRRGPCEGQIRYGQSGQEWSKALKRRVAFVEQDDVCFGGLTVKQSLIFSAELRMPADADARTREKKVDDLISILGLSRCANTVVGNASAVESRGVSGGERKRLCIATELLTDPALLFCDEPTSGLDSFTAQVVIERLRDLTKQIGITVICSIHQPNSQVFSAFERLLLLHKGSILYHGAATGAAAAFGSIGHPCPAGYNHPDWLLETLVQNKVSDEQQATLIGKHSGTWPPFSAKPGARENDVLSDRYSASWLRQTSILLRRAWLLTRPTLWSNDLLCLYVINGVLTGLTFFQIGYEEKDISARLTALFISLVVWVFFPLINSLALIPMGMTLLRKELSAGCFRLSAWFVVHTSLGMLPELLWSLVFTPIVYWMTGLTDRFGNFVGHLGVVYLTILVSHSLGILVSQACGAKSGTVAIILISFSFLFTGVFVPLEDTPLPWAAYINPLYYSLNLGGALAFAEGKSYADGTISRDEALSDSSLDLAKDDLAWLAFVILVAVAVAFRGGAFLLLRRKLSKVLLVQHDGPPAAASSGSAGSRAVTKSAMLKAQASLKRLGSSTKKEGTAGHQSAHAPAEAMAEGDENDEANAHTRSAV